MKGEANACAVGTLRQKKIDFKIRGHVFILRK
jgi:hypothetical protein